MHSIKKLNMSSDISDIDEDTIFPRKKNPLEVIQRVSSKGWDACFSGFDDSLASTKSSPFKKKRRIFSVGERPDEKNAHKLHDGRFEASKPKQKISSFSLPAIEIKSLSHKIGNCDTKSQAVCNVSSEDDSNSEDKVNENNIEIPNSPDMTQEKSSHQKSQKAALNSSFLNSFCDSHSSEARAKGLRHNKIIKIGHKLLCDFQDDLETKADYAEIGNEPSSPNVVERGTIPFILRPQKSVRRLFLNLSSEFQSLQKKEAASTRSSETLKVDLSSADHSNDRKQGVNQETPFVIDDEDSNPIFWTDSEVKDIHSQENDVDISLFSSQIVRCKFQDNVQGEDKINVNSDRKFPASTNYTMKGSKWLQHLTKHHINKTKELDTSEEKTSKMPKFVSGGLAEQAWKLENRERAARVIWSHKKARTTNKLLSKSMQILLETTRKIEGFIIAKCIILKRPLSSPVKACSNAACSQVGIPVDEVLVQHLSQNLPITTDSSNNRVIFLKWSSVCNMGLIPGAILNIFPPWQTLSIPSVKTNVILCTHFVEVVSIPTPTVDSRVIPSLPRKVFYKFALDKDLNASKSRRPSFGIPNLQRCAGHKNSIGPANKDSDMSSGISSTLAPFFNCWQNLSHNSFSHNKSSADDKTISLSGMVQRVWQYKTSSSLRDYATHITDENSAQNNIEWTVLLQDGSGIFSIMQLVNSKGISNNKMWVDVLSNGIGKCYRFENLELMQVLRYSKHPHLFSFLKNIVLDQHQFQQSNKLQLKCNKLKACYIQNPVFNISEASYPTYVPIKIYTLKDILENTSPSPNLSRFSGFAKIICEANSDFYIADLSLKDFQLPCIKLRFHPFSLKMMIGPDFVVFLEEVLIEKGILLVDKYSKLSVFHPSQSSHSAQEILHNHPNRTKLLCGANRLLLLCQDELFWNVLNSSTKVTDLVTIKGVIKDVNRETAVSWLQCSRCRNENLYEDANSRTFCETCNGIIDHTILMLKMSVLVFVSHLPAVAVWVELTCATTKKILRISDEQCQPKCSILAALGKDIGPLICCLKNKDVQRKSFELFEVNLS